MTLIFQVLQNMLVLPAAREGAFKAYKWDVALLIHKFHISEMLPV
jgi:hypothetical protein